MNPILNSIDFIARSPGGVALMRKLVLELAVRGKLVPQDPKDEPASVLLERIKREKARLVKEGKIKAGKELPEIKEEEKLFELSRGWVWVRLGTLTETLTDGEHLSPPKTSSGIPLLTAKDISSGVLNFENTQYVSREVALQSWNRCRPIRGDLLMCSRGTIGNSTIYNSDTEACLMGSIILIRCSNWVINTQYLKLYTDTTNCQEWLYKSSGATAVKALYLRDIGILPVPLPPLSEQSRIVARVQELMAVLDRLEDQTNKTEGERNRALIAATQAVSQAATPKEIASSWLRLSTNLDRLVDRAEDVKTIRAMVLELAVRGKLVPQDPRDEPASVLLERIKREKARLVKEGKIKAGKELPEIKEEEKPFHLPMGWKWERLGNLVKTYQNGVASRGDSDGIPTIVIRLADIKRRLVQLNNVRTIFICNSETAKYKLKNNDLLVIRVNGSTELVGQIILYKNNRQALFCDHFIRVCLDECCINNDFLWAISEERVFRNQIKSLFITTAGQKTINQQHLDSLILPLPPLLEQSRIVTRVQELMAVLDRLEEKLAARDKAAVLASESTIKMNQA